MKLARVAAALCALAIPAAGVQDLGRWKPVARAPRAMSTKAVAVQDGVLYLISGSDQRGPSTAVERFDLATRRWSPGVPLPVAVACTDAVALGGRIYTAGGCVNADPKAPTAAAYAFVPSARSWSALQPLPEPVYDATAAAVDGRFVVIGGIVNGAVSRRVHAYDPETGAWSRLADLPGPRSHAAGGMLGKNFVLAGGCAGAPGSAPCSTVASETFVYDPAADKWTMGPRLPVPMHTHGAVVDPLGRLFVAGGGSDMSRPMERWTYTLAAGARRWERGPDLVIGRWGPRLFRMGPGTGLFGSTTGNYPESLIEALGVPGPELDLSAPVVQAPAAPVVPPVRKTKRADALPPAGAPRPNAHAVVIGIERYRGALPRADFAASDARLTAKYFERVLGVPAENMAVLTDDQATKGDFEKYFERWLPNRVEPGDEVFVYFSGHGAPNPKSGESYLVPYDADPVYLEQTGYPIARLYARLAKLKAKRVLVAMDSCFSGAGGRSVIAKGARPLVNVMSSMVPAPLIVISAAAGDQISNTYQEKEHGLFTYYFLEGLASSGGDLRASFDYLKPKVSRAARRDYNSDQEPQWREGK